MRSGKAPKADRLPPAAGPAWLWRAVMGCRPRRRAADLQHVRNVLIVRLDEIGDMVLTIPLLRALHAAMPAARFTVVCKPPAAALLASCPFIDRLIPCDLGSPGRFRAWRLGLRALRFAKRHLWQRRYDLAIAPRFDADLTGATLMTFFSGAPRRIGYSETSTPRRRAMNRGYDQLLTDALPGATVKHEVKRNLDIARELTGHEMQDDQLALWLTDEDRRLANAIAQTDRPLIALGLSASHERKQWPIDRFIELGRWLVDQHNATVVAVGGEDAFYLARQLETQLGERAINAAGKLPLRATAALLSRCQAYIGNDTGPMHLAAAVSVPCVEISCHPLTGGKDHAYAVERFHPCGVAHRALQPRHALSPCTDGCVDDVAHCILAITVDQVKVAFEDLMLHGDRAGHSRGVPKSATLPTMSIVVPNFNAAQTLGRTLQCLIDQQYPNLEIIVVDGGSTDGSVEVIRKFEPHITWWCSEKDRGQSHAINKGFARATGQVVNWLCSDDLLVDGALRKVGEYFARYPEVDIVVGRTRHVFGEAHMKDYVDKPTMDKIALLPINHAFSQQSCFYRRSLLETRGAPLVESYEYAMDLELWAYFLYQDARWMVVNDVLGVFNNTGGNKTRTGGELITYEFERIYRRYSDERLPLTMWHRWLRYPLERFRHRHPGWLGYLIARPAQIAVVLLLGPFYGFRRVRAMNWGSFV